MLFGQERNPILNAIEPQAQTQTYQRTREMTLDDMLLENRIIFMIGVISYRLASEVIMKMLYLDNLKRGQEISLYINSPGGSVDDTMAIYDTMRFISSPVATYCIGRAQSGAAVVLAAGTKGKRFALPHAKIMLHQPWGGVTGQAEDIRIQAEEIIKARKMMNDVLSRHTGTDIEKLERETERDKFMTAREALEYGLIDEVLAEPEEKKNEGKEITENKGKKDKNK
ncbi:MAG: ATP-dependent Clp protease proteolytic subunit [Sedimentisphaerales bacterium]|nr:ATP-dependent Clp protease proteolytic subunit [Sedimentisphaerales bacterium]